MVRTRALRRPGLAMALIMPVLAGCEVAGGGIAPDTRLVVDHPLDGMRLREGEPVPLAVRWEGGIPTSEDGHPVRVLWTSDREGALAEDASVRTEWRPERGIEVGDGGAADDLGVAARFAPPPEITDGGPVWTTRTRLSAGDHHLTARAIDLRGGLSLPDPVSTMVSVVEARPPQLRVVTPHDGAEVSVGDSFDVEVGIDEDSLGEGPFSLSLSSPVHGQLATWSLDGPGSHAVACVAGRSPEWDCALSPGIHPLIVSARDGDGDVAHALRTVPVIAPVLE